MFTVSVQVSHLAAALHISPTKDTRYYLNGVFLDAKSRNVVSTDGHAAFISRPDSVLLTDGVQEHVILPAAFVSDVVKNYKRDHVALITVDGAECRTASHISKVIDGHFPDWRRIYPEQLAGAADVQFDKELLARVTKANKALGVRLAGNYPIWNGEKDSTAVAVLSGGEAHVVIMPLRVPPEGWPEFVRFAV